MKIIDGETKRNMSFLIKLLFAAIAGILLLLGILGANITK